ncbi:MAG: glycosyltransferase [Acidobacteria bacterium]|nr:glycosyltransferase [Acidobacteriota bacterium]
MNKINQRSDHLVILLATYNRLELLRTVVDAIERGTRTPHELIVIDGGSTDGTVAYLQNDARITPVLQGELLGTARCYNRVWRHVQSRYTCWLSDDTEIVPGSLDMAVGILETNPTFGMVGLKMKDTKGPGRFEAYRGGISEYGILNCNHGVLRTGLAESVGFFNENYRSYMIDPDLTASILCAGYRVVMTRDVAVLHHREWAERGRADIDAKVARETGGIDNFEIYRRKFAFLASTRTVGTRLRARLVHYVARVLFVGASPDARRLLLNRRDWVNLAGGRFISLLDPLVHVGLPYHLAQAIPAELLSSPDNPVRRTPHPAPSTAPGTSAPGTAPGTQHHAPGTSAPGSTAPGTQHHAPGAL